MKTPQEPGVGESTFYECQLPVVLNRASNSRERFEWNMRRSYALKYERSDIQHMLVCRGHLAIPTVLASKVHTPIRIHRFTRYAVLRTQYLELSTCAAGARGVTGFTYIIC